MTSIINSLSNTFISDIETIQITDNNNNKTYLQAFCISLLNLDIKYHIENNKYPNINNENKSNIILNNNPINNTTWDYTSIFYGYNCIKQLFLHLNHYAKQFDNNNYKNKPKFYLYFHNAKNFDAYVILNDKELHTIPNIKFKWIIKS